jgi:hypothetical protein
LKSRAAEIRTSISYDGNGCQCPIGVNGKDLGDGQYVWNDSGTGATGGRAMTVVEIEHMDAIAEFANAAPGTVKRT